MKVLDYNGLISLTDIIKENFIFRDTKEKVKQAIDDGKIPENAVVIITDDVASNGEECNFTPADIGLDKVGNYKAVSTEASQELTEEEKLNARNNIGAGTSSFSGSYNDLSNKPGIPTKTSELTNDSNFNDESTNPKANALIGDNAVFRDVARYASGLKTLAGNGKSVSNTAVGSANKPVYFADGVPVSGTYTLADACAKGVATTVASGNANLVTSGAVYTALQNASGGASVEKGTWTPTIVKDGGAMSVVGDCLYWKIGYLVIISAPISDTSMGAAGNGTFKKIGGLPFSTFKNNGNITANVGQFLILADSLKSKLVPQGVTEIDFSALKLPTNNKYYDIFGYYLTN